jgi:threonine dehydrogenase-like Zn-dependent dehydrogenase
MNMQVLGVHRDGGMQEVITVPTRKLHPSKELPIEDLALTEMLSIGAHATRRAQLSDDETVLVIGAGPIGMSTMLFARLMHTNVIAMDIDPDRLAFCENALGIAHTINAKDDPLEKLKAISADLPTTVFDATGNLGAMNRAFEYVTHGGKLVFVGLVNDNITFHDPHFHSHEMTLFSSRNATSEDFDWVISSLASGKISLNGWITHTVNAQELVSQFSGWLQPGSQLIKAMLAF